MRKKYLSALLFGALLFASAGTFTSCKDYDDDISNLQGQVDGIKADLEDLQAQISAGKWITNITSIEGGFTVTFSDGQSFNIVNGKDGQNGAPGAAGAPGTSWEIGEDGYWYKDGEKTEYKAAIDGEAGKIVVPEIKDGIWYVANEKGELEATEYKANGATYAVAEANGGFTIYAPTEDGKEMLEIFLPGAAAAITSMNVEVRTAGGKITINQYTFNPDEKEKADWEKMTGHNVTDNKYILASADKLGLRVNPTDVELKDIDFVLLNSKNEELTGVVYEASEYTDYVKEEVTRANGNGLWTLSMKQMELKDDAAKTNFEKMFTSDLAKILYALSADHATRAEYNIGFNPLKSKDANIGSIKVAGENVKDDTDTDDTEDKRNDGMVDTHKAISVAVENPADLYDMWLTVSKEDEALFGIKIDNEKHTFTITGDPDILTKVSFALTVHTMNNNGEVAEEVVNIYVSDKIAVAPDYAKRTLNIVSDQVGNDQEGYKDATALESKNAFTADMATLLNALGEDQANVWKKKVTGHSVEYYTDKDCKNKVDNKGIGNYGIELIFVNAAGKDKVDIKDAANMKFSVDNSEASSVFAVDKEYFAKVTFTTKVNGKDSELNSIVIPFQFAIPDFANSFEQEPAVFIDGVANAYMNVSDYNDAVKAGKAKAAYKLSNAFANYLKDVKLALDKETKIGETGKTSYDLATIDATFNETAMIYLKDVDKAKDTNIPAGYGQELIVNASAKDYMGWAYPDGKGTYTFTIKVMSPLYEGTVSAIGDVVNIPATSVSGWNMTNEHIQGKTYNNISYNVLPDVPGSVADWSRPEVAKVQAATTNPRVVQLAHDGVAQPARIVTVDGKTSVRSGYITVLPQNIAATTETTINVTVTDIWGYAKTNPVKVEVTVGE